MYRIWNFFISHNRFSYLAMIALIGLGFFSLVAIPKESAPEVIVPVGIVTTILPGAPATDIESLVTNELERGLASSLENVKRITSVSREGVSSITVEFDASADIDESITDLKDEIDTLTTELPDNAEDPIVSEVNFVDQPILTFTVSGDLSERAFSELGKELEREIESVPGVARLEGSGLRDREVSVIVNESALSSFGLTVTDVIFGLRSANNTFPVGQIVNDGVAYNIAFEGDIKNPDEVQDVVIGTRNGTPIYIHDVATVIDGLEESQTFSRLSVNGEPSESAVSFDVFKQSGGDITRITDAINSRLDELQNEGDILAGLTVRTVLDLGKDIKRDLIQLSSSGTQTVILVILILIVAIGWREGLIAGTAIPLSFVIGFIGLYLSGNTINFISLFALILGIGVLVDSSIVMVEGINKRMKDDPNIDKKDAALKTIKEFSSPIIAGTLTTVSMFVGLFVVSGVIGQFIGGIPFTIVFILFASLLVALGFIPLIASTFLRRRNATRFEAKQVEYAHTLENWYRTKLESVIGNKRKEKIFLWSISIAFVVSLLFPVVGIVKVIFFEQSDIDFIYAEVELPAGSVKEETDIAIRRVEEVLYQENTIDSFVTTIGAGSLFGNGGVNEKLGSFFITLRDDREESSTEIVARLRENVRDIRDFEARVGQPSDGPPTGAPIGIKFLGEDIQVLNTLADQTGDLLAALPGTADIRTSTNNNQNEFVFTLDAAKAAALGLSPETISQTLRSAVFGADATAITTLTDDITVSVKLNLTDESSVSQNDTNITTVNKLENISLTTSSGETVLLGSVVDVSLREANSIIAHEDQKRLATVSGNITGEGNVLEINAQILEEIESKLNVPEDVTIAIGGETEESNQAFIEMGLALILGITLMLAVLVLQFNSFRHTLYVLSILPFSLIGIMIGLAVTQNALSFPSIMGFIALSGIVVNNSILLIDMMNEYRRKNTEKPIREAVIEASVSRFRPILLTTITTVVGMVPLTYTGDLWAPLAYAVMFGLSFSVIITLLLIPIIYNRKPGEVS